MAAVIDNNRDTIVLDKVEFDTQYSKKTDKFISESGSPELQDYEYQLVKNVKMLVPSGKHNVYDRIQAETDSVDINKLMLRFQNGEVDVFDRVSGVYFDSTDMPKTFAEMQQRVIDAENMFSMLDPQVKEAFNNNPIEFFDQYGTDEFNSKMEKLFPSDVISDDISVVEKEKEVVNE